MYSKQFWLDAWSGKAEVDDSVVETDVVENVVAGRCRLCGCGHVLETTSICFPCTIRSEAERN